MDRRAVVVVTEGAAPELLERWCGDGLLPSFSHLLREGRCGNMVAEVVPYEPPGLASAFTGHRVGDHGWYSYWTIHEEDYQPRCITSEDQLFPFIWDRAELGSLRAAVVNLFGTNPPRPMNGWMITYPMEQTLRACHPPDLVLQLSRAGMRCIHDVSVWFSGQARCEFAPRALAADRCRADIAQHLYRQGADLLVVNLTGIDRLSHVYWQELEMGSPVPLEDSAVFQAYRLSDCFLGGLLRELDDETTLIAFSEIGFGPVRSYVSVNDVLASQKLLAQTGVDPDWEATTAFEAVQGSHGVNINLKGRYGEGFVVPDEYHQCRREVIEVLREAVNPYTGLLLFSEVQGREEVYSGSALEFAPDVVLFPADERYLPLGDPRWSSHVARRLQSGWHRRSSYWAAIGVAVPEPGDGPQAEPVDIAASVFDALCLDIPADVAGRSLLADGS